MAHGFTPVYELGRDMGCCRPMLCADGQAVSASFDFTRLLL